MKNFIITLAILLVSVTSWAETTLYVIRVDGLACPYCAYGIEKKFNKIKGVKFVDIDLNNGIVTVRAFDVTLDEQKLKKLFRDAGFTYRGMRVIRE